MTEFQPFKLSRVLSNHTNDVRSCAIFQDGTVVTTSRDGKAILATTDGTTTILVDGQSFLNSVAIDEESGFVFVGSHDSSIIGIDVTTNEQLFYLGHNANVSCLDFLPSAHKLASGSWDHSIRIWNSPDSSIELQSHNQNVWDVKFIGENKLLSASADKTIKLWDLEKKKVIKTFQGHSDVVRSLLVISPTKFISASNDGTLRVWDIISGNLEQILEGHTSFVYSLALINSNYVVSSGEDRTVRIWDLKTFGCVQTIVFPSISQWCVSSNGDGDFVVGSSDNIARVFTQSSERMASQGEIAGFEQSVRESAMSENEIDESQLVDAKVLNQPGKQEGQIVIIRNANQKLEAHQFSAGVWSKLGDVVGQSQASGSKKQLHNGQKYDYVFDVDITDGAPPLKLPFNSSDNPYDVAEKFISHNNLPPSYLEQVVQFLIQNSQAKSFDTSTLGSSSSQANRSSDDGSSDANTANITDSKSIPTVLQYSQLLFLKAFQPSIILSILQKVADERGDNLSPYNLEMLLDSLPSSSSDLLKVTLELKGKWHDNLAHLLPIFDLLRIAIADATSIPYQVAWINLLDAIDADIPKHCLLAIRGIVNLVGRPDFDSGNNINGTMLAQAVSMIVTATTNMKEVSKPMAVALSTLVLNLAVQKPPHFDFYPLISTLAPKILSNGDPEAVYRLVLAIGLRSVASSVESHRYKKTWFVGTSQEERIKDLLGVVLPRIG